MLYLAYYLPFILVIVVGWRSFLTYNNKIASDTTTVWSTLKLYYSFHHYHWWFRCLLARYICTARLGTFRSVYVYAYILMGMIHISDIMVYVYCFGLNVNHMTYKYHISVRYMAYGNICIC